jgi:hypothetical protein
MISRNRKSIIEGGTRWIVTFAQFADTFMIRLKGIPIEAFLQGRLLKSFPMIGPVPCAEPVKVTSKKNKP